LTLGRIQIGAQRPAHACGNLGVEMGRPARVAGREDERIRAFRKAREQLRQRITLFLLANRIASLPGSHAR